MEDSQIVGLYLSRDQEAIAETYKKYGGYCYSIALNILSNPQDAEECVNDALMNMWNSIPPQRPAVLSAYVGTLTRRAGLRKWRSGRAAKRGGGETALALEELGDAVPDLTAPDAVVETRELSRAVHAFLLSLKPTERGVFIMRYWYIEPIARISGQYGFTESKVKSMLQRTRKKLKEYLLKEGIYDIG